MITRQHARLLGSPPIAGLVLALGWFVLDPKGDARRRLVDRGVRFLDRLRDVARM